ncbi:hypothetical protein FF80_00446 [Devosia sp. LC5]|uniref:DUF1801 domain-containing protein n=1 Tax=Devosia sp. LC5 TaxID=1502724 RepID=UPI0004E2D970|nr:hypothetical protein [Devosia sp. LC5]KFC71828.1 hypothetical protein FF80_00446 [Devosia sp. LC5]
MRAVRKFEQAERQLPGAPLQSELDTLLAPLPEPAAALARRLVALVAAHPGLSGEVKTGWKSINFRHAKAGHVCALFPHPDRVSLYFEQGRLLDNDHGLFQGEGLKKGRFIRMLPGAEIPIDIIGILIAEAIALQR